MSVLSLQSALHEASGIKVGGKIPFDPNNIELFLGNWNDIVKIRKGGILC